MALFSKVTTAAPAVVAGRTAAAHFLAVTTAAVSVLAVTTAAVSVLGAAGASAAVGRPGTPAVGRPGTAVVGRPGTPVVTALGTNSATISWQAPSGAPDQNYVIWRVTETGNAVYTGTRGTTYTFAWLTPGTEYTFFVVAEGASWLPSDPVTFRTLPAPDERSAPSRPGTPTVTGVTDTAATLQWPASTDDTGVVQYRIHRILGQRTELLASSLGNTATLRTLMPDMPYTLQVTALDAAGNESAPSDVVSLLTRPDAGSSCTATYAVSSAGSGRYRLQTSFTNTGRFIDGWTLRITFPPGVQIPAAAGPSLVVDTDLLLWHTTGGNYGLPVGGSERFSLDLGYPDTDPSPTAIALNGHRCAIR